MHHTLFCYFHIVRHFSATQNFDEISLFKPGATLFDWPAFWINLGQIFFSRLKYLLETNFKQCRVYIYGKNSGNKINFD